MSKTVTIQYRELKPNDAAPGLELQSKLVSVLRRRQDRMTIGESARLRIIDLDQDESYVILNKVSEPTTWDGPVFCGQLIHLQPGTDIHAVMQSLSDDTDEFLLQSLSIAKNTRVVRGVLYFALHKNHVGLIESQSVKGLTLERYLTALFQRAGALEPGQRVTLNGKFSAAGEKGVTEFSDLTMHASQHPRTTDGVPMVIEDEHLAGQAQDGGHKVADVLKVMGWSNEAIEQLFEMIPAGGRIEGLFKVFIKNKRSKLRIPRATVNEVLRNFDPDEFDLLGDGREKGGLVKLSMKKEVEMTGSLIDPVDAMIKIVSALREWSDAGKIDCKFEA